VHRKFRKSKTGSFKGTEAERSSERENIRKRASAGVGCSGLQRMDRYERTDRT
jgi:hypothetical protein